MLNFQSLIPEDLAIAPKHPLEPNLEVSLPDAYIAASKEIQEIEPAEPKELRIPGVVKRIIPLDAETSWEYWWCVPNHILLPEDVELMTHDLPRVESILEKLVWLFGGHCFSQDSHREGDQLTVHNWQDVLEFASQHGFKSYLLDVDYLPTAIRQGNQHSHSAEDNTSHIAVEPAHWHVEFFQLATTSSGFKLQQPKTVCSCQIWTGKPFIKHLHTGEISTRYDLWVSRPLDLTQPPWHE